MSALAEYLIPWSDEFQFGLSEIDEQHRSLFALVGRLWSALALHGSQSEVLGLIGELEKYTVSHFSAEEAFMQATGYMRIDGHKKAHDMFKVLLTQEKHLVMAGQPFSLRMLSFFQDWLVSHILIVDREYAANAGYYHPKDAICDDFPFQLG